MADQAVAITAGSGTNIDTRTESTNSNHRQVVILGDPSVNDGVAEVRASDPDSNDMGVVVRDVNTTAIVSGLNSIRIRDIVTGTVTINGTLTGITNTIGVVPLSGVGDPLYDEATNSVKVSGTITGITNSIQAHILSTGGTIVVKLDPAGAVFNNAGHTASVFTVSGSTAGVSDSGVQLVAPSANYSFKVFAFSLQTTGIVSLVARFTNGGGSATEFWRGLVTANQTNSTPVGANLAVQPPGFLFATGTNTTLALHLNTASLVHYSVSYIKETA